MYEQKTARETAQELSTDIERGLTEEEASKRLKEQGANELAQPPARTLPMMFAEQLNDPLIYVLFAAAAVSLLLKEYSDSFIILSIIALNAAVGMVQEGKAQRALEALKKLASPTALVKRDGLYREIQAAQLVKGDVVLLENGCQVPADIRLITAAGLRAEESALTGESVPAQKEPGFVASGKTALGDKKNMLHMSTSVVYGRGEGIVTATGMETEIGRIAGLINAAKQEETPLQKKMGELGKYLSAGAVFLCAALFVIAILQKRNILQMLLTAISLAVAAVPEGLPAVVTIVMALSVSKLVKVNTIVRRLPAVETLGAVSVVCSDKTGTLTQNKMHVVSCYTDGRLLPVSQLQADKNRYFLEGFTLCNDAVPSGTDIIGDPTETALVEMSESCGIHKSELERRKRRVDELPFDSERKMMTTLHRDNGQLISYTKGSCDIILKRCTGIMKDGQRREMTEQERREIIMVMENMSRQALRVLALALRQGTGQVKEQGLTFIGLAGMMDPPREEAAEAVRVFREAGVKTVMITGDYVNTALSIAQKLGIASGRKECMTGDELDRISDAELQKQAAGLSVFARVSPQHKVRIVQAYKANGAIAAMTGDGVNDAPSLKAADIGIAMGRNGTDVAKNASDMVLADDNFATIEKAIEEGRGVYANIRKSVLFLLSSNFGEIITMFLAVIAGLASPLKAGHILWVNLLTDSLPALALGVDENDKKQLMHKPPRNPKESLFAGGGLFCTVFYGILIALITLTAFLTIPYGYLHARSMDINLDNLRAVLTVEDILVRSQTYAFTVLGVSELFHAVGMRNVEKSVFINRPLSNPLMLAAFVLGLLLQAAVTEVPFLIDLFETAKLSLEEWSRLILLSAFPVLAHEILLLPLYGGREKDTDNLQNYVNSSENK